MHKTDFLKWVNGGSPVRLKLERRDYIHQNTRNQKKEISDADRIKRFNRLYTILAIIIGLILLVSLVGLVFTIPEFGSETNPTNNEIVERYVGHGEEETGAENVIAGMILNYRGFDTFGESNVLFLAVCCVMLLLMKVPGNSLGADMQDDDFEEDMILSGVCKVLLPCVLVFGVSVLFGGHTSPGGGFSGGSILGAALILCSIAFGQKSIHRFFTERVFNVVRVSGLMIYAIMFGVYIYQGVNGIESDLAHYIVLVIDIAVGLVVMSTMYGFYSFYTKGEL